MVVGDDEDARPDPCSRRRRRERLGRRQRVPPLPGYPQIGQLVDAEERGSGNVRLEVPLAAGLDPGEVVPAVDEPVPDQ
jgi:hypothetical protein